MHPEAARRPSAAIGAAGVAFAVAGFVLVHVVFAHLVFWLAGMFVAETIDGPARTGAGPALAIDLGLVALFGLQHTGMARRSFKRATAWLVAPGLERAVYVWCAVIALFLVVACYQPIPDTVWHVDHPAGVAAIWVAFTAGWAMAAAAYLSVGIPHLLGVSQALAWRRGEPPPPPPLVEGRVYGLVRNPQQLGLLVAFWATPHMSLGHLVFACAMTVYIFVGMAFEERDLAATHGEAFRAYKARVPRIVPRLFGR